MAAADSRVRGQAAQAIERRGNLGPRRVVGLEVAPVAHQQEAALPGLHVLHQAQEAGGQQAKLPRAHHLHRVAVGTRGEPERRSVDHHQCQDAGTHQRDDAADQRVVVPGHRSLRPRLASAGLTLPPGVGPAAPDAPGRAPVSRPSAMSNVAVVGAQWGDEGKGKIVDWLSERADVVVRFQGGHNAGHTLVIDGTTYKLSLLPSGVVRQGKLSLIGNGVVVDPWALLEEIERLRAPGRGDRHRDPAHRRERGPDPAAARRARPRARGGPRGQQRGHRQDRHHRPRHRPGLRGQGGAPRDPDLRPRRPRRPAGQDPRAAAAPQRAAPRLRHRGGRRRARCWPSSPHWRPSCCRSPSRSGCAWPS